MVAVALALLLALPLALRSAAAEVLRRQGGGSFSMRFEDVDLADVARALHHETGLPFVVIERHDDRLSVDFADVPLESALETLRAHGVARLVVAAPRDPALDGLDVEPTSLAFKDVELTDLAALLAEVDGRPAFATSEAHGRVSVFATEVPRTPLFRAVFDAAGLVLDGDESRIVVRRRDGQPRGELTRLPKWLDPQPPPLLDAVAVAQVRLVGITGSGAGWTAWVYTDDRRVCWPVEEGHRLLDAEVERVVRDHVVLRGERRSGLGEATSFRARLSLRRVRSSG